MLTEVLKNAEGGRGCLVDSVRAGLKPKRAIRHCSEGVCVCVCLCVCVSVHSGATHVDRSQWNCDESNGDGETKGSGAGLCEPSRLRSGWEWGSGRGLGAQGHGSSDPISACWD